MTTAASTTARYLALHEALHPLGDRQADCLTKLDTGDNRQTLIAIQAGLVAGVRRVLVEAQASAIVYRWVLLGDDAVAAQYLRWLTGSKAIVDDVADQFASAAQAGSALTRFGDAYQTILAGDLRHRLGEHYTPALLVASAASVVDDPTASVLDPACGDGRFLGFLLSQGHEPASLHGLDLNPLAVLVARLQVWFTSGCPQTVPTVDLRWGDFLLTGRRGPTPEWPTHALDQHRPGFIVGNPPWVLWRNLGDGYRKAIAAAFAATRLNQASGWGARVAAGQTDIAHLFVHDALERLAPQGRFALVLPRSVFKGPIGASVIRTGRLESGRRFTYERVIDYQKDAFPEVRQEAVVAFATADETQQYPVRWETPTASGLEVAAVAPTDPDDSRSPWSEHAQRRQLELAAGQRRWKVKARGGVNTGGGNGIFHVTVIAPSETAPQIANRPSRGVPGRIVEATVEAELVRPLLAGRDVTCWTASPAASIVFPHDPTDFRKPLSEDDLITRAPRGHAFLQEFKKELSGRKELARWGGEWYSLFRVGPYSADCWRVVWPSSSARNIRAAVLSADDRTIPDQKVVLVPFDDPEPAFYLCALLNSSLIRERIADGHGIDASPSVTERLMLPEWDEANPAHVKIMELARQACATGSTLQAELDDLVTALYV